MTIKFGNFANFSVRYFVVVWEAPILVASRLVFQRIAGPTAPSVNGASSPPISLAGCRLCYTDGFFGASEMVSGQNFPENPALPQNPPGIPTEVILSAMQNPIEFP